MITATIYEAKTNLSELVKQAQKGETVIITSGRDRTPWPTMLKCFFYGKPTGEPAAKRWSLAISGG
jgi:hypothetical protein